jgi:hypothetical protein
LDAQSLTGISAQYALYAFQIAGYQVELVALAAELFRQPFEEMAFPRGASNQY